MSIADQLKFQIQIYHNGVIIMKKLCICIFLIISTLLTVAFPAFASEVSSAVIESENSKVISFADGSKYIISPVYYIDNEIDICSTSKTRTAERTATYENSDGELKWKYTLIGTFSYIEGVSSICTNSTYTQEIYSGNWKFSDGSATKSGNVAYGKGKYVLKYFLLPTKTYEIDISLTCDKNGNVT